MGNTMMQRVWVLLLGIWWASTVATAMPVAADRAVGACERAEQAFAATADGPWAERAARAERLRACLAPGSAQYQAMYVHQLDALLRAERFADADRVLTALHRDPAVTDPTVKSRAAERGGRAAAARKDRVDAVHQYRTAILHDAARNPDERAALRQALARQYRSLGQFADATAALNDALSHAASLSPHRTGRLHLLASEVALSEALAAPAGAHNLVAGQAHHRTAGRLLAPDADATDRARLAAQRALYVLLDGDLQTAETAAAEAVHLADATADPRLQASARVVQARLGLHSGRVDDAVERLDRATAILQRHDAEPLPSVLAVRLQVAAHNNRQAAAQAALRELATLDGPDVAHHRKQASLTYVNAFSTPEPGRLWWGLLMGVGFTLSIVGGVAGWRSLRRSPETDHPSDALDGAPRSASATAPDDGAPTSTDAFGTQSAEGEASPADAASPRPNSPTPRKDRGAMAGISGFTGALAPVDPDESLDGADLEGPPVDDGADTPPTAASHRTDDAAPVPGLSDEQRARLFDTWGIPEEGPEARVSLPLYLQSGEYVGYRAVPLPLLRDVLDRSLCLTVDRGAYRLLFVQHIPSHELLLSISEREGIQLAHVNTPIHGLPLAYVDRSVCGVG